MKGNPLLKIGVPILFSVYVILYIFLIPSGSGKMPDAFVVINDNIVLANKSLAQRLQDKYNRIANEQESHSRKGNLNWEKATQARKLSGDLLSFLEELKNQVIAQTEKVPLDSARMIPPGKLKSRNDFKIPTRFFLGNRDDDSSGAATALKAKMDDFRNQLAVLSDPSVMKAVDSLLSTRGPYFDVQGRTQTWQHHFFYHTSLMADITLLNTFRSAVYNAAYEVMNSFDKSQGKGRVPYQKIQTGVIPESNFVILGDEFKAQVLVPIGNKNENLKVYFMQGVDYLPVEKIKQATVLNCKPGHVILHIPARKTGKNLFAGFVKARTANGQTTDYHFKGTFIVYQPWLTISATKMNVFFTGIRNPVSISVSGIPTPELSVTISCGSIQKNPDGNSWFVTVPPGKKMALVQVFGKVNGEKRQLGSQMFRIKNLPSPYATIAGRSSGGIDSKILLAAGALTLQMPDNVDFDETFSIRSFTLTIPRGFHNDHFQSNSPFLTQEMRDQIKRTNPGQNLIFEDIKVLDPNGGTRKLAPFTLTIE